MRGRPLFWSIFLAFLGIIAALIVILGLCASYELRTFYLERKAAELEAGARAVAARIGNRLEGEDRLPEIESACVDAGAAMRMRITVILPSGVVIGDNRADPQYMESHLDRPEVRQALRGSVGLSTRFSTTVREQMMYVGVPVFRDRAVAGVVRASFPIQSLTATLRTVYWRVAIAGLLAALLAAAASGAAARHIARPLETIRRGAEQFARGDLRHRLPASGAEEIRMLGQAMNQMAQQLDRRIQEIVRRDNEHRAVLSSMEEGVLAVDPRATILKLNDACAALLGVEEDKVCGRLVHEVIRKPSLLDFIDRTLSSSSPIEQDFELNGAENHLIHARGSVLHDAEQRQIGALIVLHDVTRLRHLEIVRRDFVANVSHELRTPITSIKGFVETLLHEGLQNQEHSVRFLQIVARQVDRLDAIIQDLLTLSRVERGTGNQTVEMQIEPLETVLRSAVEVCEQKAIEKQITVDVQCPEGLAARMNAPLLEQAVMNLIDNAIKYSDAGSPVRVVAGIEGDEVVIRVQDNGCGIAARHLPRLFERFYRVDRARSREMGGTGLGLAIVKHIVAAHKGHVRVESEVGAGSTFSIHLKSGDWEHANSADLTDR